MSKRPIILREGHTVGSESVADTLDGNAVSRYPRVVYTTSRRVMRLAVWCGYSVRAFKPGIYKLTCGKSK